jgi:hypothetical protein
MEAMASLASAMAASELRRELFVAPLPREDFGGGLGRGVILPFSLPRSPSSSPWLSELLAKEWASSLLSSSPAEWKSSCYHTRKRSIFHQELRARYKPRHSL